MLTASNLWIISLNAFDNTLHDEKHFLLSNETIIQTPKQLLLKNKKSSSF